MRLLANIWFEYYTVNKVLIVSIEYPVVVVY